MVTQIGRYQVDAELGRGGFGRVYRAFDPTVGRYVAIKTLTASDEPEMLRRFRNEAAAAGRLRHPNIVVVYDFGEHDGSPFLVMELLDGEDVEGIISNRRNLTLFARLDIMLKAAEGLHHAHTQGIFHRDVKPANIMLLSDGGVKIMDFGIALVSQATAGRLTPQGSIIGTLPYMAPEQLRGSASDALTDIFAFGITFYRLLTGTHPFDAPEVAGMMFNIMHKTPAPVRDFCPAAPEALQAVMMKLLEKDPEGRYQSLEDLHFDLEPIAFALREENVGSLLSEARSLLAAERLDTAQSVVRQVIELDPGNRTARELREQLQRLLKSREIRPRVASLVLTGREQLGARQFDSAIRNFESAWRLDQSNPELLALIEQARAEWEQAQQAEKLLEEASRALRRDDLTVACRHASDALATDPQSTRAVELLETVGRRMETRNQEEDLRRSLDQIRTLIFSGKPADAVRAATELCEEHPECVEAGQLLKKALDDQESLERQAQLEAGIHTARELLGKRSYSEASRQLSNLLERFPHVTELHELSRLAATGMIAPPEAVTAAAEPVRTHRRHAPAKALSLAIAAAALVAALALVPRWSSPRPRQKVGVEIHTTPEGVHTGGQSCTPPNCPLSLAPENALVPGSYQGEVSRKSDLTLHQTPDSPRPGNEALAEHRVLSAAGSPTVSPASRLPSVAVAAPTVEKLPPAVPEPSPESIDRQEWERVRASTDVAQLRDYLRSHPNSSNAKEAEQRIADLLWNSVDVASIESVRKFARDNPGNPHRVEAQRILDQYDAEQQHMAQERARQDELNKQQVLAALKQFDSALQHKRVRDVKAIWPGATQLFLDSLANSHVRMTLTPKAEDIRATDSADRVSALCDLVTSIGGTASHQKARLTLRGVAGAWTIEAAKFD